MTTDEKKLMRLPEQGQVAGVCAGIADYFEVDVTLVRIVFVVLAIATGGGMLLAYLVLAIVMPVPEVSKSKETAALKTSDGTTIKRNIEQLGSELQESERGHKVRNYAGIGLIVFGVWLLAAQYFPQWLTFRWDYVWPVILILAGFVLITRKRG